MWNRQKAIEAILYLANRVADPTVLKMLSLLYLADKLHLSQHGRLILRDDYVAMECGPVAANAYALLKEPPADFVVAGDGGIAPCRNADALEFSRTDNECLNEAIGLFGRLSAEQLIALARDEAWAAVTEGGQRDVPMPIERIADTLPNAAEVRAHLDYMKRQGYL